MWYQEGPDDWHGRFSAVVEAHDPPGARKKFEELIKTALSTTELFNNVQRVYLNACIEVKTVPRSGFLAYIELLPGSGSPPMGGIMTALPGVAREHAAAYGVYPDSEFADAPFVMALKKKE